MYGRMYVRTDKGKTICPSPLRGGGIIRTNIMSEVSFREGINLQVWALFVGGLNMFKVGGNKSRILHLTTVV